MGTWGIDSFDNDDAADWAFSLEEADDLTLVDRTLQEVLDTGQDYLEANVACESLAACEVLARLKGHHGRLDPYSEPVDQWVAAHKTLSPQPLVQKALGAIDRILTPPSELMDLWEEAGRREEWRAAVEELRSRVLA